MGILLDRKVLSEVHAFQEPDYARSVARAAHMPEEAFKARGGKSKLNLQGAVLSIA